MDKESFPDKAKEEKFQVQVGEKTAWVEVVSLKNKIYVVEIPGSEPLFITQIRDESNKQFWISMPQGKEDIAKEVGEQISRRSKNK